MKNTIRFTFYGKPVPKGRPRFFKRGNFVQTYTPKKTLIAEQDFGYQALPHKPKELILGEIQFRANIYRDIPKSFSLKKALSAENGTLKPLSKPDLDNYLKLMLDALNGLFWHDDAQITDLSVSKRYSKTPRIEVEIHYD